MQNFHGLILFVWIVSILTLSRSDVVKTDGTAPLTSGSSALSKDEQQTLSSFVHSTTESVGFTETLKNNGATPQVAGEGGPISISSTMGGVASHLTNISDSLNKQDTLLKEEDNIQSTGNRKINKIVSRKGANEMLNMKQENVTHTELMTSNNTKLITESSSVANTTHNDEKHIALNTNKLKLNITAVNSTINSANVSQENVTKSTAVTASSVQEHRPKPTATVVGPNSDKRAFISHTKGAHLGMSKKIDYVLPVIVTLISLPILGAIIFMIYKQGRDCWDKRHYRRMDFLIDGMYND